MNNTPDTTPETDLEPLAAPVSDPVPERTSTTLTEPITDTVTARPPLVLTIGAALAIVLGSLVACLPLAVGWTFGAGSITVYGAQSLEMTGGLDPDVFAPSYWLALALNVTCLVWGFVRLAMRRVHPWRPLFWLMVTYAVGCGVFVTLDAQRVMDVPDGLTTTALLGLSLLWSYVLPFVLVVLLAKLGGMLWRVALGSAAGARRVIAGFVASSLVVSYVFGSAAIPGPDVEFEPGRGTVEPVGALPGDSRGGRAAYIKVAAMVTTNSERTYGPGGTTSDFAKCMGQLGTQKASPGVALERAIRKLARSMRLVDAEDVAHHSLLKVCLAHAKERIRDLGAYFWVAVENGASSFCKKNGRVVLVPEDELPEYISCERFKDSVSGRELAQVLKRLSNDDQLVLRLHYFEGRDFAEVGALTGVPAATARKRSERALARAYEAMMAR